MDKPSCLGPVDHCVETVCLQFCPIWWTYPHVPVPVEDTRCLLRLQCQRNKHHLWGKFDVSHVERHHNEGWAIPIPHLWLHPYQDHSTTYDSPFAFESLTLLNSFKWVIEGETLAQNWWNVGPADWQDFTNPMGYTPQLCIYICAYIYIYIFVYGIFPFLYGMNYGFYT